MTFTGRGMRRAAVPVAAAILAIVAVSAATSGFAQTPPGLGRPRSDRPNDTDFSSFWLAAWWVRERPPIPLYYPQGRTGQPNLRIWTRIRGSTPAALYHPWQAWGVRHDFPNPKFYLYPPIFALVIAPLTWLPVKLAIELWGSLSVAAFVFAMVLLAWAWAPARRTPSLWIVALIAFSAVSYPVLWTVVLGQNSLMLLALWAVVLVGLERRWESSAGAALGSLVMVKLSPIVLLPWLLWRRLYRAAAVAMAVVIGLTGLSVWLAGWEQMRTYFTEIVPLLSTGTHYVENQSLLGFLLRLTPGNDLNAPPAIAGPPSQALWWGSLAALSATQLWGTIRRSISSPLALRLDICTWMLFLLMISPVSWSHHYVNALVPLLLCSQQISELRGPARAALIMIVALCYLLIAIPPLPIDASPLHPSLLSHRFFGALLLWATLHAWPFNLKSAI